MSPKRTCDGCACCCCSSLSGNDAKEDTEDKIGLGDTNEGSVEAPATESNILVSILSLLC